MVKHNSTAMLRAIHHYTALSTRVTTSKVMRVEKYTATLEQSTKSAGITSDGEPVRTLTELSDSVGLLSDVKHVHETRGSAPQRL